MSRPATWPGGAGSRAIDYLLRAGARGRSLFANEEAIGDYSRAVELVRADPDQAGRLPELLLALADLQELVGNYDDARRLYEEVRDLTGEVAAWRGIAATLRSTGRFSEALEQLDAAFASQGPEVDLRALWLERAGALPAMGKPMRRCSGSERAWRTRRMRILPPHVCS